MSDYRSLVGLSAQASFLRSYNCCLQNVMCAYYKTYPEKVLESLNHELLRSAVARLHARELRSSLSGAGSSGMALFLSMCTDIGLKINPLRISKRLKDSSLLAQGDDR